MTYDKSLRNQKWERKYVIKVAAGQEPTILYPSPPHTIHPPHIGSTILRESVIVFQRLQIHYRNEL